MSDSSNIIASRQAPIETEGARAFKDKRKALGQSQKDFGARFGLGRQTVRRLEKGQLSPGLQLAVRIQNEGICPVEDWTRLPAKVSHGS